MSPLEAALTIALLVLPFHLAIQWQLSLHANPRYVRKHGVVICREEILERTGSIVGHYRGRDIPGTVVFMGMQYRFAGIVPPAYQVKARELVLAPGLVYLTD